MLVRSVSIFAAAAFLNSARVQAYFAMSCGKLTVERLDPVVFPGVVSPHVHSIVGGNNFNALYSQEEQEASSCTSCPLQPDKSNYWAPQLYWKNQTDNSLSLMDYYTQVYYLDRPGPKKEKLHAFPPGLRMVAGDPMRRSYNKTDKTNQAVDFVCLGPGGQQPEIFKEHCTYGMRAQVVFPTCWDGVNLDSPNHKSHMAYPVQMVNGGDCPATHPVHMMTLFLEFIFATGKYPYQPNADYNYIFSTGDTTGYGMHADFSNGWAPGFMQRVIDECPTTTGFLMDTCPLLAPHLDRDLAGACRPQKLVVKEEVGQNGPIKELPGCNPVYNGPGKSNTPCTPNKPVPGLYDPAAVTLPAGWTAGVCVGEAPNNKRALTGAQYSSDSMTVESCVGFCNDRGFSLAGVEYGRECYCGNAFSNKGGLQIAATKCRQSCAGNNGQICGGGNALSLYRKNKGMSQKA